MTNASKNTTPESDPSFRCFMCARMPAVQDKDWPLESLTFIYGDPTKLCQRHKDFCKIRIAELEYEKSITDPPPAPTVEIPKQKPAPVKRAVDFSEPKREREPGEEG